MTSRVELLRIAVSQANLPPAKVLRSLETPDWEANRRWEWELYIPYDLQAVWGGLSVESKLTAYIMAFRRIEDGESLET